MPNNLGGVASILVRLADDFRPGIPDNQLTIKILGDLA